ncbi:MAG: DUF748 domain-containing protein [Nitrosomonas sp.]|nr:DUF748 domain-containing protein [Nitrosomonas sp.]
MTQTTIQAQSPRAVKPRVITRRRLITSLAGMLALIALFGLLGYYWLPGFVKSQLEMRLSVLLERPVTVQAIEIKPYTLELSVRGFRIGEKPGGVDAAETFFTLDHLYVDIDPAASIAHRAPVISMITLDAPYIRLARNDAAVFNFSDLHEKFSQPAEDEPPALFSVSNIELKNGRIEWVDRLKSGHQSISEINFAIPFIANLDKVKADWVRPHFSAQINGAPFLLDGKLRPFTDKREATLSLKLTDANLADIADYLPLPVGISLVSGYFDSDLTVTFSQSGENTAAITLSGKSAIKRTAIRNQSAQIPYQVDLGSFHVSLEQFDLAGQSPSSLMFTLDDFALTSLSGLAENKAAVLSLTKLSSDDVKLDFADKRIVLDKITLIKLGAVINRSPDGSIELMRFFSSAEDATVAVVPNTQAVSATIPIPGRKPSPEARIAHVAAQVEAARAEIPQTEDKARPWIVSINQLRLNAAAIHYTDQTMANIVPMSIDPLDLVAKNIDISGEKPLDLAMTAVVNNRGSIESRGLLAWSPFVADMNLDLKTVDLVSLQGWAGDALNVLLTSGDISFNGSVKADGNPLNMAVNGQARLGNFSILDLGISRDVARWKSVDISGLDFAGDPLKINMDAVKLDGFYAHVILQPDGELNLHHLVRREKTATGESSQGGADTGKAKEEKPLPLRIGKIVLQQSNVDFHDRFIRPNYHARLTGLHGQIGPIQAGRAGAIDIKGAIDKSAPLEIQGSIQPFDSRLALDIAAKAKAIDLPSFSPYSGKYIGYGIEKGKLSVDVHYRVEEGALTAKNNVFLDQLTLGSRVESEDALSLPLELAIALLKNRQGEIDIHLPIKGSLDDPKFSLGDIMLEAFVNLITRAVTAPFALLGSMLGENVELSEITFSPGSAVIEAEAENRLQALSQILSDRPALRLEIAGHIDPAVDYEGIKQMKLRQQIVTHKRAADAKKGETGEAFAEVELTPDEYSEYLEVEYKAVDFEKPTNFLGLTKKLPDQEMEQLLLQHATVSADEMNELAQNRALAAQSWLLEKGGVAGDRVFVTGALQNDNAANDKGSRAQFTLK